MNEKYTTETATHSTAFIGEPLKSYLLYGTSAAVLVLIIVLIARECAHRRKCRCASKSKTDSDEYPLSPSGRYSSTASTESQTPNQRDHVQSVLSDDISFIPTDPRSHDGSLDRDEPMDRDLDEQPASRDAQPSVNPSNTNQAAAAAAAPKANAATLHPGRFQGLWKHPEMPKIVTLKPVVATKKKNAKKTTAADEEKNNSGGGYVEADRLRNLVGEAQESDIDDELYMNAVQPSGTHREGRGIERGSEDDDNGNMMYVNTLSMGNRKR